MNSNISFLISLFYSQLMKPNLIWLSKKIVKQNSEFVNCLLALKYSHFAPLFLFIFCLHIYFLGWCLQTKLVKRHYRIFCKDVWLTKCYFRFQLPTSLMWTGPLTPPISSALQETVNYLFVSIDFLFIRSMANFLAHYKKTCPIL